MGAERAAREEGMSEEEAASYSTLTPARALVCLAVILAVAQGAILDLSILGEASFTLGVVFLCATCW